MSDYPGGQFISVAGQGNVTAGRGVNYYVPMSEWTGVSEEILLAHRAHELQLYNQEKRRQKWNALFFCLMILAMAMLAFGVYFLSGFVADLGGGIEGLSKRGTPVGELIFVTTMTLAIYITKARYLKVRREASQQAAIAAKAVRDIDIELKRQYLANRSL